MHNTEIFMKYRNIYENTNKNHFAFEWHFRWYFAIFIMIIFVSVKLPDAHNIKVNSMFILCWGGHALIQIFYILSLSIPLHLMNFLSTVGLLIRKCFANSIHSTSSHSGDILVALLSTFPMYTAHSLCYYVLPVEVTVF